MRPHLPASGPGGFPRAAVLLGLLALGGCATAPPPPAERPGLDAAPFAFRDPRDGAPLPAPAGRDAKALDAALGAVRRGDGAGAEKALSVRRKAGSEEPPALALARLYLALARGERDEPRAELARRTAASPTWVAAVEAEADLAAAEGRSADALERYRTLARLVPSDRRAQARVEEFRALVAASKRQEAESALAAGDLDAARRSAHALLQLEPASVSGLLLLSRSAAAGGKAEDAWTWAREARRRAPADRTVAAFAGETAAKAGRWADAAAIFEELAASDPAFVAQAEEARLEFRIQNLPEAARTAANSVRLTRAQLATLLWWAVPEFREALVPPGVEIAVDVVDRPDRTALVRAIGLGYLSVSPETHRVGAETALTREALAGAARRVALLAGRGRTPAGCLGPDPPIPAQLSECGILSETPTRNVTGREALRALEKAARLGREGGTR